MVKVAPSLLSANFTCLKDDIEKIENGKADWLHYDVWTDILFRIFLLDIVF